MKQIDDDILEQQRLAALDQYDILDTPAEKSFDRITRLARNIFEVPMSTVSLIDGHRQWFKSRQGSLPQETCKSLSFCNIAMRQADPLVVPDAITDHRFQHNGLVLGQPHIRFYAGAPLRTPDGFGLGALCIIDTEPRQFGAREIEMLRDLAEIVTSEIEAQRLVTIDAMTGALSRHGFRRDAGRAVSLAIRHGHPLSCIAFDLDHFKAINDRHGHAAGDLALTQTVELCHQRLRNSDFLGRLGGEEFAILLPHTSTTAAMKVAEGIRDAIGKLRLTSNSGPFGFTASLGIAGIERTPIDLDELLRRADSALYAAKNAGRNCCVAWENPGNIGLGGIMRRVLKAGKIGFNSGRSTIDCTVRALSDGGADLDVVSTAGIPERFKLLISSDDISRQCTVLRKLDRRIEVAFQ